ncbi:MAG: T9SS type A sorting domain-containing protein [Candidatus Kapaibacteriota bacterium]
MKKIIFLTFIFNIFLLFEISYSQTFTKVETPYKQINKVKFLDNNLMIVTGDSLFIDVWDKSPFIPYFGGGFYASEDFGGSYKGVYLDGYSVFDITQVQDGNYYAIANKLSISSIFSSENGYNNWNMNPLIEESKLFYKLSNYKNNIYLTSINSSEGLTISNNGFESNYLPENLVASVNDIKIAKNGDIFLASDNENYGHIIRSTDGGKTWTKEESGLQGLRILCVQPSSYNPAFVYCGADSITINKTNVGKGIFMSLDTGKTWQLLAAKGYRVFDIQEHPTEPIYLAAACGILGVGISGNAGQWFDIVSDGLPANFDVRGIAIPNLKSSKSGIKIYANLLDGGLYKSTDITSGIEEVETTPNLKILKTIVNNHSNNELSIIFTTKSSNNIKLNVFDCLGNIVYSDILNNLNIGNNQITINNLNLYTGSYFVVINDGTKQATSKIVLIK